MTDETAEPVEQLESAGSMESQEYTKSSDGRDVQDFVQDDYYADGHTFLKVREFVTAIFLWFILLAPIFILINSLAPTPIWPWLYHWDWSDGWDLSVYITIGTAIGFVVVLAFSIYFLVRNNIFEKHVYPSRKNYDYDSMLKRKAVLEAMYAERFGPDEERVSAMYYAVEGEQNIPEDLVDKLFDEGGCPIR
ncbi:MAG: hypothetical protein LBH13_01635 [Cellulomonadaceae bacterium]|jgi:hypothetical protein|nr:hypothetical protein [Cellulomonadaceae bacterium]